MDAPPFAHAAITAFLEPGGWGPLLVWRACPSDLLALCRRRSAFDPRGHIEPLLLGGCEEATHPGREALEDHFRTALAWPEPPSGLQSGSAMGRRAMALTGASPEPVDQSLGFLDLLIHAPERDARIPGPAARRPREALPEGAMAAWGLRVSYCGQVAEGQWDTYLERALAVAALLDKSTLGSCCPGGPAASEGRGRL